MEDGGSHRLGGAERSRSARPRAASRSRSCASRRYRRDKAKESLSVYRTEDVEHPGVGALHDAGDYCVAGELRVLDLPSHDDFLPYRLTPAQTRAAFAERG